jgi:hypothetical protein
MVLLLLHMLIGILLKETGLYEKMTVSCLAELTDVENGEQLRDVCAKTASKPLWHEKMPDDLQKAIADAYASTRLKRLGEEGSFRSSTFQCYCRRFAGCKFCRSTRYLPDMSKVQTGLLLKLRNAMHPALLTELFITEKNKAMIIWKLALKCSYSNDGILQGCWRNVHCQCCYR